MIVIYDGTHMSNYNISRRFFFPSFFQNLNFLGRQSGSKRAKDSPQNDRQKILLVAFHILKNHTSFHCHLCYTCVKG